ncbi:MAG: M3 family metallopeptidase [Bacilli bacterium]|nr:M3 family metallopeptidase [Bacilli bacterium]
MKTEWDFTHLYKNEDEWYKEKEMVEKRLLEIETLDRNIFNQIDFLMQISEQIERLYCYGQRKLDLDAKDEEAGKQKKEALSLFHTFTLASNTLETDIIKNKDTLLETIQKKEYQKYTFYIQNIIKQQMHAIKEEDLKIWNQFKKDQIDIPKTYRAILREELVDGTILDENGEEITVNPLVYETLSKSKNRDVRRNSFIAYYESLKTVGPLLAPLLDKKLEEELFLTSLKNFSSPLEASLYEEGLSSTIIEKLISKVQNNHSILEDYYETKKQYLKVDRLYLYDKNVSIVEKETEPYTLEQAISLIKKSLRILGESYNQKIDIALQGGYADLNERENKRTDSFSAMSYVGVPYFSMIYNGSIQSVRTLAHELGHTIHTMHTKKNPFMYYQYSILLAEITSKVNEILVYESLYEQSHDKEEKIKILEEMIQTFANTLIGQIQFTEFENALYKEKENKKTIKEEKINQLYLEIVQKYNKNIEIDPLIQYNWERIGHFFYYNAYYVWKYAMGFAVAVAVVYQLKNDVTFKTKYIKFLEAGGSMSPLDALKIIDIDLKEGNYMEDAFTFIKEKIENLKKEIES